jgi:F420H(2)-dependent quinone reductase
MTTPPRGHSDAAAAQTALYEESGGLEGTTRVVEGVEFPCVLLTYRGRRSRELRSTPIIRVVDADGVYFLVGSLGGAPRDPWWAINLRSDPHLRLRDRERVFACEARELSGAQRDAAWRVAVDAFPPYAEYQNKTDRLIPVFACSAP